MAQRAADSDRIGSAYASFGGEIWRALLVVAGGRTDLAEEATAEAFSRYLVHARDVRDPRAWLYRTGSRIVIDELRRERRHGQEADTGSADRPQALSSGLTEALRTLSPEQRLCMFLTYYMDLPARDVARLTGSSLPAVKMRLNRARRALREQLGEVSNV